MRTIGLPISLKENEKRRALVPSDLRKIDYPEYLYLEYGYGKVLGYEDSEYERYGCHFSSKEEILKKDLICDPKIGDAQYINQLSDGTILFGWIHAVQNKKLTDILLKKKMTVYAWEDMFEQNRHVFWKNNELAGEAAVIHAIPYLGKLPHNISVAVLGRGNTARGAVKMLSKLGANIEQFDRKTEKFFRNNIERFDIIVNCVLWDVNRKDHIIYKSDLSKMKNNAMIIDVSCDEAGAIETSHSTTIQNPVYIIDGIIHYVVDHTPSLFYRDFTEESSKEIVKYLNLLIKKENNTVLEDACIIKNGKILDDRINSYQNR